MRLIFALTALFTMSCTDSQISAITAYGDSARIVCHSGGKVIYDGRSTGKIHSEQQSDGYYFRDAATGRLIEVSGECFIDYGAPKDAGTDVRP